MKGDGEAYKQEHVPYTCSCYVMYGEIVMSYLKMSYSVPAKKQKALSAKLKGRSSATQNTECSSSER